MTTKRYHPATYFISGLALAALLSAAPVRRIFGGGIPNTFVAGTVASADEVNENFDALDTRIALLEGGSGTLGPTFLGTTTSGFVDGPPTTIDGGSEFPVAQIIVSVPTSGTTNVQIECILGEVTSGQNLEGTLRVNGVSLTSPPVEMDSGYGDMRPQTKAITLYLPAGPHSIDYSIHNEGFVPGSWDLYQASMSAWFMAD